TRMRTVSASHSLIVIRMLTSKWLLLEHPPNDAPGTDQAACAWPLADPTQGGSPEAAAAGAAVAIAMAGTDQAIPFVRLRRRTVAVSCSPTSGSWACMGKFLSSWGCAADAPIDAGRLLPDGHPRGSHDSV